MHIIYGLGLLFGCSGRLRQKDGSTDGSNTGRTGESNKNELCGYISMTQLLSHTYAHLTGSSFRVKAKLLPNKNILGVKYN